MKTEFYLDAKEARTLGESSYISRSGEYIGAFDSVRVYESSRGATMLNVSFVANEGERGTFQMCLYKADGEQTFQKSILDSILTVFRLRSVSAEKGVYKDKNGVPQEGYFLRDLMNKKIGLVVQLAPEEFLDKQGILRVSNKLNILTAFDSETRQNAREILDNLPAERVDRKLATLKDKELKKLDVKSRPAVETTPLDQFEDVPF